MKKCKHCGSEISGDRGHAAKYCSVRCARSAGLQYKGVYDRILDRQKAKAKRNKNILWGYGHKCAICGWSVPGWSLMSKKNYPSHGCQIHHIVPVSEGGDENSKNLILLCPNHHLEAHAGLISKEFLFGLSLTDDEIEENYQKARLEIVPEIDYGV